MKLLVILSVGLLFALFKSSHEQRITTIQLDGVQYFVSRMNPYSPELNFFLAYQYCRSLGLQLVSFETREKADSITQYLSNAGFTKYDFWTSGNKLGTNMYLWMSTGLPFNATFNYLKRPDDEAIATLSDLVNSSTSPQRTARESGDSGSSNGCVALKTPTFEWATDDCTSIKDFICEQTRCYYYNYGSIPVSSSQGKLNNGKFIKPSVLSSPSPMAPSSESFLSSSGDSASLGVLDFVTRLRSTQDQNDINKYSANKAISEKESGDIDKDLETFTNGPYNNAMQDDPIVSKYYDDHNDNLQNEHGDDDIYVSTIVPEYTTLNSYIIH